MDKKKLIYSIILRGLAFATLLIMIIPIAKNGPASISLLELAFNSGTWVNVEEYLWGIAGIISLVSLPLLTISADICVLSACGVIKNQKLDKILYIVNIVLASLVVAVIVNYFLGLGRTFGKSGLKLFAGTTYFKFVTPFFFLHCILSIGALVVAILNKKSKK